MTKGSLKCFVDIVLASTKSLEGIPSWERGTRNHDRRLDWVVLVEGQSAECVLMATAYPEMGEERFTISLVVKDCCVWRLDYDPIDTEHVNPLDRFRILGIPPHIRGQHFHSWEDNSYLASKTRLPDQLHCARKLPVNVRGWENSFRWFCGQTKIRSPTEMPSYPPREELFQ